MKSTLILLICFALSYHSNVYSQLSPSFGQYSHNSLIHNPATAGADHYGTIRFFSRDEMLGFSDDADLYSRGISFQKRFLKESWIVSNSVVKRNLSSTLEPRNFGIGGYIITEKVGHYSRTGINFSYAYHIAFQNAQLSLGLSAICFQFGIDDSKLHAEQINDALIENARDNSIIIDSDFGVSFMGPTYNMGISINQLGGSELKLSNSDSYETNMKRRIKIHGGYLYNINESFMLEPSALVDIYPKNISARFGLHLFHKLGWWVGADYDSHNFIVGMAGVQYGIYSVGYAYETPVSNFSQHTSGTHEILIGIKFGHKGRKFNKWIRY